MNFITTIIVVLFIIFVLRGAWRGFSGELAPLVGLVAFVGTLWYSYPPLTHLIASLFQTLDRNTVVFYAAIVATTISCVIFSLIVWCARNVFNTIIPQPFNALLGAAIGALKVLLIVSVIGGLFTLATNHFKTLREETAQHPFTAVVTQFWINHFKQVGNDTWQQLRPNPLNEAPPEEVQH